MSQIIEAEKEKLGGMALDIPTIVGTAQAAVESGNGTSYYARKYNNYFGLYSSNGKIMKFKDPSEGAKKYLLTLLNHRGYKNFREDLRQGVDDPFVLVKRVAKVYAEDPKYYRMVAAVIRTDMYSNWFKARDSNSKPGYESTRAFPFLLTINLKLYYDLKSLIFNYE